MKDAGQALVSPASAALQWVTIASQTNACWIHMSQSLCWWGLEEQTYVQESQLTRAGKPVGWLFLGGMAALLPKLLIISHSKILAFVYHSMLEIFPCLGQVFVSENISQSSSAVYENKGKG